MKNELPFRRTKTNVKWGQRDELTRLFNPELNTDQALHVYYVCGLYSSRLNVNFIQARQSLNHPDACDSINVGSSQDVSTLASDRPCRPAGKMCISS
jgi:hypothetical protein